MELDGTQADVEFVTDFGVGLASCNREEHLLFAVRQRFDGLNWHLIEGLGREAGEEPSGDSGIDECITLDGGVNRLNQLFRCRAFEEKATGACLQSPVNVLVGVECGYHRDRYRVVDVWSGELAGGLDAIDVRHSNVEQANVGSQFPGKCDGFAPVGGLPDNIDIGLPVEDGCKTGPNDALVIGDDHTNRHDARPRRGSTASTPQPRSGLGPAVSVPPSSVTRSVMPTSP